MQTIHSRRIIALLLVATLLMGCGSRRTIREYRTDTAGRTVMSNVTEEQYWKEKVDERIAAEIAKEKPEAGYDTWQNYWRWWYSVLRRKKKPPFKSPEFKKSEDLVNYIKEKRRAKGLPTYEDGPAVTPTQREEPPTG
ncbi:MAG: hypothetical protein QOE81_1503 [Verrucomicrobiota bacterium]|jgi:hypothetical protein